MAEIARPNHRVLTRYTIDHRFNMPVENWLCGPVFPVKLWDMHGNRSVPGQLMREAGVKPRFLNVDNYDDNVRYLNTHIVPNDVVPIKSDFSWLVDKMAPRELLTDSHPMGGILGHRYPIALHSTKKEKVWDILIKLNDSNMVLDTATDRVVEYMTWETRAFWIRELLRRYGVGIAFRLPRS